MSRTESSPRAVYVQTNEAGANRLVAFARAADGSLSSLGSFPTGGAGDGVAHLTSQGSVVITGDGEHVLVTNAGSGDMSLFAASQAGLTLVDTVPTGAAPKSVAEHDGLVYVLNTGAPSLAGFRIAGGRIEALPGSGRELAQADPAQVGFSPDGSTLVVTQRGADSIAAYPVDSAGLLGEAREIASAGPTPYGFAFTSTGTMVVTEAFGAARGKAAASSYTLGGDGISSVSRSVGNGRSEICWAIVSKDDRYAFTTNFADGAVSRYAIGADGSITLEDATAGLAVDGQTGLRDEDISADGRYLYAVDADSQRVFGWSVGDGGSLEPIGSWDGLPATVAGLAAS
ncbi:MAG: lactonase family protein [Gaiellales bacterium]